MAFRRLGLEDVDEDRVADVEGRLALAMTTEQLAIADDAFALRTDVDEDLVLVDPNDVALDHVAVLEALDVGVLLGQQLGHRGRLRPEVARGRGLRLLVVAGSRCIRGIGVADRLRSQVRLRSALVRRWLLPPGRVSARGALGVAGHSAAPVVGWAGRRSVPGARPRPKRRPRRPGPAIRLQRLGSRRRPRGRRGRRPRAVPRRRRRRPQCPPRWRPLAAIGGVGGGRLVSGRFGGVRDGGGLVGDLRRDGVIVRRWGVGGDRFRLRRGPARLVFGQQSGRSLSWIHSRESQTA